MWKQNDVLTNLVGLFVIIWPVTGPIVGFVVCIIIVHRHAYVVLITTLRAVLLAKRRNAVLWTDLEGLVRRLSVALWAVLGSLDPV